MQLKIGTKIIGTIGILLIIIISLGLYIYSTYNQLQDLQKESARRSSDAEVIHEAVSMSGKLYSIIADAVINQDYEANRTKWVEVKKDALSDIANLSKIVDTPEEAENLEAAKLYLDSILVRYDILIPMIQNSEVELIKSLDEEIDSYRDAYESKLVAISKSLRDEMFVASKIFDTTITNSINNFIVVVVIMICIGIILSWLLNRNVHKILNSIISETERIKNAALEGKLDSRCKTHTINFEFRDIAVRINQILDAIIKPLNLTAEYVDRVSKGDIPPKISDDYKGDFNEIKNNLNMLIDSTIAVTNAAKKLAIGDTNIVLSKRCAQDEMIESILRVVDSLELLSQDTAYLAESAESGNIKNRTDSNKHNGDYKRIIDGINHSLDRLVGLIDNIPVPVQIVDKEYRILYLNREAEKISN